MRFRCIGCNRPIDWTSEESFCYTCPCGATIFYDEEKDTPVAPASLVAVIKAREELPHLDHLVGRSHFTSPLKERFAEQLTSLGATWMKDCEQCLEDGTYQSQLDREVSEWRRSRVTSLSTPCGHES
ncbi:hypothetical protein LCGC14_1993910 [marine sediment metagenome]|uniref:Uncharacterized protein n=1 Tax=marine sediment metagenome TaxID=412755 RepID=A0A0F9HIM6_9ZZZZ